MCYGFVRQVTKSKLVTSYFVDHYFESQYLCIARLELNRASLENYEDTFSSLQYLPEEREGAD